MKADTPTATAIWLCGLGQKATLEGLIQEPLSVGIPIFAVLFDGRLRPLLDEIAAKHTDLKIESVVAETREQREAALSSILGKCNGHVQIMLDLFRYHPASFSRLNEIAHSTPEVVRFDYLVRRNVCFWVRGASYLHRHNFDIHVAPPDIEGLWLPAHLIRPKASELAVLRAERVCFSQFAADLIATTDVKSTTTLAGYVDSVSSDCADVIREPALHGVETAPDLRVDIVGTLVRTIRRCLAGQTSTAVVEHLWSVVRERIQSDRETLDILALLLVDELGIGCITNLQRALPETAAIARESLMLEAPLIAPNLAASVVSPILQSGCLAAKGQGFAIPAPHPAAFAQQFKELRDQVVRWQMEYANSEQRLLDERIRFRRANKKAAALSARLKTRTEAHATRPRDNVQEEEDPASTNVAPGPETNAPSR